MGIIQSGIIAGKLNGAIPATTPNGCRRPDMSKEDATPSEQVGLCVSRGQGQETRGGEKGRDLAEAFRVHIVGNLLDRVTHHQRRHRQ